MSDITPNLRLPYILSAQAQKHVTHNEAIRALDALVQISVASRTQLAPPATPADGARFIVPASATGAWTGFAPHLAAFQDGAWVKYAAREGWLAWVEDEDRLYAFDGTAWIPAGGQSLNPASLVGVNTTADTTNRLAVAAPASLFTHAGNDHRHKINKATAADTASLLYQTGFSGRAEVGLAGDDNLHVKVSPDGTTWKDALVVDRTTGAVSLPFSNLGGTLANPWQGRRWTALGTSITAQGFYTAPLATLLGATLTNLGVSGGHISVPTGGSGLEIYNAAASIPSDAELVTLEAGINDFGRASALGTASDTTTATFYGALLKAGQDILAAHPQRVLVYVTPYAISTTGYPGGANWNTPNANGNTLTQFQQAVRDVAHRLGCPVIDMAESNIGAQTASVYLSDGLHVNTVGGMRMAQFMSDRLAFVRPNRLAVATPTFSPPAGTYAGAQSVSMACATSGAAIYYTTDGSTPTTASPLYTAAVSVAANTTLKAIAVKAGMLDSAIASAAYVISATVATPTFSPAAGTYASPQSVAIACATPGATIYVTTDGSPPTTASPLYAAPISVTATTTIKALAVKAGLTNSAIASATYTISASFSPLSLAPALWFDASDASTLFQDAAGTTLISADGQALGKIADKSGNGRHLSASALGPVFRSAGSLQWFEFDGTKKAPMAARYTTPSGNFCVAWASRRASASDDKGVLAGVASMQSWVAEGIASLGNSWPGVETLSATGVNTHVFGGFSAASHAVDHVGLFNVSGGTAQFYQNGVAGSTATGVGTLSVDGLTFGTAQYVYAGRIYQFMLIPRPLTTAEIGDLTAWLKAKVGL